MSYSSNIKKCKYCNRLPEIDEFLSSCRSKMKLKYAVLCSNQKCHKKSSTTSTKYYSDKSYAIKVWNKMMEIAN